MGKIFSVFPTKGPLNLQKYYRENHLTKNDVINRGQLPQYHVVGAHEAIISMEDYLAVQEEIARRAAKHAPADRIYTNHYPYTGLITCGCCGAHYTRKVTHGGPVWICRTYNTQGKAACPSKAIPERVLDSLAADISLDDLRRLGSRSGRTARSRAF